MTGSKIPRFFLYATAFGIVVAAIMLSLFYAQYHWLANQIVTTSYEEHRTLLEASFERRMRAQLHAIADSLPDDADSSQIGNALSRAMNANPYLNGLRFADNSGRIWSSGNYPGSEDNADTVWLEQQLLLTYPVTRGDRQVGSMSAAFSLVPLQDDLLGFTEVLQTKEGESRRASYYWIGGGTTAMLLLCGGIVWLIVRGQTRRIRELKAQAERFRDADFGEPLPESRGDELGALAAVFNDMRDKLRTTTHSRNYVDKLLSGMNEAIISAAADTRAIEVVEIAEADHFYSGVYESLGDQLTEWLQRMLGRAS